MTLQGNSVGAFLGSREGTFCLAQSHLGPHHHAGLRPAIVGPEVALLILRAHFLAFCPALNVPFFLRIDGICKLNFGSLIVAVVDLALLRSRDGRILGICAGKVLHHCASVLPHVKGPEVAPLIISAHFLTLLPVSSFQSLLLRFHRPVVNNAFFLAIVDRALLDSRDASLLLLLPSKVLNHQAGPFFLVVGPEVALLIL